MMKLTINSSKILFLLKNDWYFNLKVVLLNKNQKNIKTFCQIILFVWKCFLLLSDFIDIFKLFHTENSKLNKNYYYNNQNYN
jgi:hypothetical protein